MPRALVACKSLPPVRARLGDSHQPANEDLAAAEEGPTYSIRALDGDLVGTMHRPNLVDGTMSEKYTIFVSDDPSFTSEDVRRLAGQCFTSEEWSKLLLAGKVSWNCWSNVYPPLKRKLYLELKMREEVANNLIDRLRNVNLTVRGVGCLKISISERVLTPMHVARVVQQYGLGTLNVRFHSIGEVERVGEVPIFEANVTSFGTWKKPFERADKYIVGRLDILEERHIWPQFVCDTLRKARNIAADVESARPDWEHNQVRLANEERKRVELEAALAVADIKPGDEALILSIF